LRGGKIHPVQALETPPMLFRFRSSTRASPPAQFILRRFTARIDVADPSASIAMGILLRGCGGDGRIFLRSLMGMSNSPRRAARYMAERASRRREQLTGSLPRVLLKPCAMRSEPRSPIVLMDVGDNVGAGSPANSTILFSEF